MTAIAYRDGIMAADTAVYNGHGARVGHQHKIIVVEGYLVASCGPAAVQHIISRWIAGGCVGSPDFGSIKTEDIGAIVVRPDGVVLRFSEDADPITGLIAPFHAVGSASGLMMGAMAHGATAEKAVLIACDLDAYAGGPVQVERLVPVLREVAD